MRRRKIVRRDYGKVEEFEEVRYGMLMMVLCDREGRIYDVWISFEVYAEASKGIELFEKLVKVCTPCGLGARCVNGLKKKGLRWKI